MYCSNCGNKLNNNDMVCSKCGTKKQMQNFQINNITTKSNTFNKLWVSCAVILVIISFIVLFSGVFIGIGTGYENPDSSFDFAPFGIGFAVINIINILFNIIMLIIKKQKR